MVAFAHTGTTRTECGWEYTITDDFELEETYECEDAYYEFYLADM